MSGTVVVPIQPPRRCWLLAHYVDTDHWEVDESEEREVIAIAMPTPQWAGGQWIVAADADPLVLTWAPDTSWPAFWMEERHLHWTREGAVREAHQLTVEAWRERRAAQQRARRAARRAPSATSAAGPSDYRGDDESSS